MSREASRATRGIQADHEFRLVSLVVGVGVRPPCERSHGGTTDEGRRRKTVNPGHTGVDRAQAAERLDESLRMGDHPVEHLRAERRPLEQYAVDGAMLSDLAQGAAQRLVVDALKIGGRGDAFELLRPDPADTLEFVAEHIHEGLGDIRPVAIERHSVDSRQPRHIRGGQFVEGRHVRRFANGKCDAGAGVEGHLTMVSREIGNTVTRGHLPARILLRTSLFVLAR